MRKNWTPEEDAILTKNFATHSLTQLVELLPGRNYNAVKARQTFLKICPVYKKDNSFFGVPNVLNSSIAGVIASDGHISPPKDKKMGARIFLGVNTKDRRLLEYFNFFLKSNYTIKDTVKEVVFKSKTKKSYTYIDYKSTLCISSANELSQDLWRHWRIPAGAKSLIIGAPNIEKLDLSLAYIKGLIIGDGTILVTKIDGVDYLKMSLVGTESLLIWAKSKLEEFLGEKMEKVNVRKERNGSKIFILSITGVKATKIIAKLNQLETIKLDRKFCKPEVLRIIKEASKE